METIITLLDGSKWKISDYTVVCDDPNALKDYEEFRKITEFKIRMNNLFI